ncbi:uncharacterized protein LOC107471645 [Arachis duranensis]|uniref:Uncharacterized protein LOC107471645 n=1 Tax=Arachis duranensis TaxID=130453 RepID=A0A9C6TJF1_ARADU|nr:uncharacterized protein LOC107471645 [Arachis duranensis]
MSSLTPAPSSLSRTSFFAIPSAFSKFQLCPLPSVPSSSSSSSRVLCRGGSSVQHVATDFKLVLHDALDASGIDTTHARKAREEFCSQIRRFTEIEKETSICINRSVDLGRTALYIAAEDDSLVSHSSVPLPVDAFISRLDDLSMDYCPHYKPEYDSSPEKFLESIERFLYVHKGFSRANENLMELRPLYLHSVLTHRSGSAVMLSLIYSEIMKMLRLWGLLYFDAEIFFPHECTYVGLSVQVLNNLKHAFWPFQHDSNKSLFLRAAHAANCVDRSDFVGESGSQIASAKAAQHRLDRGVWTSVRFGDMRRSLSACERLILMNNNDANEFRDYSILLYHCGLYEQSLQYLNKYQELKNLQAEVNSSDPLSSLEDDAADKLMMRLNLIMMEQGWSQPTYARNFLGNSSEPW